jgi:hypothetical protein
MSVKSQSYDHPAYTAVRNLPIIGITAGLTGSVATGLKYAAFTNEILKSVTIKPATASNSADVVSFIQISGTTTTTTALTTFGSGATTFTNVALATQPVLLQGDTYYVVKGTDTAAAYIGEFEVVTQPLANLTV